jgi:hypothetical protein
MFVSSGYEKSDNALTGETTLSVPVLKVVVEVRFFLTSLKMQITITLLFQ